MAGGGDLEIPSLGESGDGSDDDLTEYADAIADYASGLLHSTCSNPGMDALADMIDDEIYAQAEGLPDGNPPSPDGMFQAIAGVHSSGTAHSCMTQGITAAYEALAQGYENIVQHEAAEGVTLVAG